MEEFRLVQAEEFQQAIDLADQVFRKEGHLSMGVSFPQVFSAALNQAYGAFIDGKLVSFIGLVPSTLIIEGAEVQAYSIGAVCTQADYRRKGLANKLLQMVFDHVNKSGGSVLFVSGDLSLYLKQGCSYYGKMNHYVIYPDDLQRKEPYRVRELQPYDWFQMRKLINKQKVRYEQSIFDLALLNDAAGFASIFKMKHKILVAEDSKELQAFLVFGVPYHEKEEVDSRVIEWGGDEEAIPSLLRAAFTYGLDSVIFNIPSFQTALTQQLVSLENTVQRYPGTIKIMNLDLLLEQLTPYLEGKIEFSRIDESRIKLTSKDVSGILSNQELEELILTGNPRGQISYPDVFPIPFPFPQGLNYV